MINIFKNKWSKWIPLGIHTYAGTHRIVLVKKNLNSGMLKFKDKSIQSRFNSNNVFIDKYLIDVS